MKVFVYSKNDSKKIATITDVSNVAHGKDTVVFTSKDGIEFKFDTRKVKTTSYQN